MTLPMLWVGGAPGAGKSTVARTLALAEDLPVAAPLVAHVDATGPGARA